MKMNEDKLIEFTRYDARAKAQLLSVGKIITIGSATMPQYFRSPYVFYEQRIADLIKSQDQVLELGSGTGLHTWALVQTGAFVCATDIAPSALKFVEQRMINSGKSVTTRVADIEQLPFVDNSFDVVACAGILSYGDSERVNAEIKRVLKPGGILICVDSLNNNPVYRINRWIQYLRGIRTESTYLRMPDVRRIKLMEQLFENTEVKYFDAIAFIMPALSKIVGEYKAQKISTYIDSIINTKKSAFKFVFIGHKIMKANIKQ
jgi:ubiquinone/menaquinone biosynthesis C-methylase UbiE